MKIGYPKDKLASLFIESKEKIIGIAIITLTLMVAFSIYRNQARKLQLLNIQRDTEIKKNALLSDIQQSEKKIDFYKKLLNEKDSASITNKINDVARDANVKVISIQPGAQEQQPLYIKYPFVLTIGADSYHAIGKFIGKIESYSDVYFVDTISIISQASNKELSQAQQTTDKLTVNLVVTIIAFTG